MLQSALFVIAISIAHTVPANAQSSTEIFQEQKAKIAQEFSSDPSLRVAMEYVIYADIMRMLDKKAMLRPTFLFSISNDAKFESSNIMKRLMAITNLPSATIDLETLEGLNQTKTIAMFQQKLFAAIPNGNTRMHIMIKIPEKPLNPEMQALFEKIEEMMAVGSLNINDISLPLRNVDFLFYTTFVVSKDWKNNDPPKSVLQAQRNFPKKFLQRMRQIFILSPGQCAPDFE